MWDNGDHYIYRKIKMKSDKLFRKVYLVFQLSVQFTLGSQEAQRFGFKPTLLTSLKSILIALLFPATLIPASLSGEKEELSIAKIFTDHGVLQRDMPTPIWGKAEPGTPVKVRFANQSKTTKSDQQGKWQVQLDPMPANSSPAELTVSSGSKTLTLTDILVGEVWLCSGQSNMGLGLSKATGGKEAIAGANHPKLRLFRVKQNPAYSPVNDIEGEWIACSPDALSRNGGGFSAVGFFFGRQLLETLDCPIGLIGSYVGGSPVEAWMSEEALSAFPDRRSQTVRRLWDYQKARDGMDQAIAEHAPKLVAWEAELEARNNAHRDNLKTWSEAVKRARESNQPLPTRPKPVAVSRRPLEPNRYPHHATVLYRGMIEPLIPYGIRGAIWYQGEANCYPKRAEEYATSFPMMIADWRKRWAQGDFPFLFVQLPNFAKAKEDWMTLRESQRQTNETVANTAMAITIDVGDPNDLHPANKKPVGERLALLARAHVYGEKRIANGPLIKSAKPIGEGKLSLSFLNGESGLQAGVNGIGKLGGFEVAGEDGQFASAEAEISGNQIIVSGKKGIVPKQVRYAWAPNPFPSANLYNQEGLPASPFSIIVN
jgi:sialate O-acetylesterase